jgi:hypothetical protein
MGNFWIGVAAGQHAAAGAKSAERRHPVVSIIGGVVIALLIGAGMFVVAALSN